MKKTTPKNETPEHLAKDFANLMFAGKVHPALRMLDKQESLGVAKLNDNTLSELKKLHPDAKRAVEETLEQGEKPYFDYVVFTNIDEKAIATAATRTKGAAGPSGLDADGWRRMLVSKNYGKAGKDL